MWKGRATCRLNLIRGHNPGIGDKRLVVVIAVTVSHQLAIAQARYNHRSREPERSPDHRQVNLHEMYLSSLCKQADVRARLKQVGSHLANLEFDGVNPGNSLVGGRGCFSANANLPCELRSIGSLSEGNNVHPFVI